MALLISQAVAQQLLSKRLIQLRTRSQRIFISCNFHLLSQYPRLRNQILQGALSLTKVVLPNATAILNANNNCLTIAQNLANLLFLPMIKVRRFGKHPQIMRSNLALHHAREALLVIDVVSNPSTLIRLIQRFRKEQIDIKGVLAFFTFPAVPDELRIHDTYVNLITLVDYHVLLQKAHQLHLL